MEEEIENEKFKIVKVFDEFPRIIHFSIPNSDMDVRLWIKYTN